MAWVAIAARAVLMTSRIERYLLGAIVSSMSVTTLYLPHVSDWLNNLIGYNAADFIRQIGAIVGAAVMVLFALAPARRGWIKWWLIAGGVALVAILLLRGPAGFTQTLTGTADKSPEGGPWLIMYFIILSGYASAAMVMTIIAFLTAAQVISDRFTRICLRLICVSLALIVATWVMIDGWLFTHDPIWLRYIPHLDVINTLCLAAALLIALGGPITLATAAANTTSRLRPLWAELTPAVPGVVLRRGSSKNWLRRYDVQRTVIEVRDCILVLSAYVGTTDKDTSERLADAVPDLNGDRDAMVTALCLQRARANKTAGKPPTQDPVPPLQSTSSATLASDAAELIKVANAYRAIAENAMIMTP